jgi:hypothetical protein
MKQELKPFQHIIDILIKKDGWLQVPLIQKEAIKTNGKNTYTTYSFNNFLHVHTDSGQQRKQR